MGKPKGLPKTGGRTKGTTNKRTAEFVQQVASEGLTPLDYMLKVMRDDAMDTAMRNDMAKAAAPYVHPRLANIEHKGEGGGPIEVTFIRYSDKAIR
jgi:hypothetical protein